jgi:5-methylcytosine-specific restriction endonuclease McrA
MPIKPENKARYPANWQEIRAAILDRAGHACEICRVPNKIRIVRGTGEAADFYMDRDGNVFDADDSTQVGRIRHSDFEGTGRWVTVVLTIAHLDHTPENCEPSNLKALCQRCHLRYDAGHHAKNARETRRAKLNNLELFQ